MSIQSSWSKGLLLWCSLYPQRTYLSGLRFTHSGVSKLGNHWLRHCGVLSGKTFWNVRSLGKIWWKTKIGRTLVLHSVLSIATNKRLPEIFSHCIDNQRFLTTRYSTRAVACGLTVPCHYPNQCWLMINRVLWYPSEGNFSRDRAVINHQDRLENHLSKIWFRSPKGHRVE